MNFQIVPRATAIRIKNDFEKKSEISAMRKNRRPYTYVGLGGVEMDIWWGLGVWVLHKHYAQSHKIVNFHVSLGCQCTHCSC